MNPRRPTPADLKSAPPFNQASGSPRGVIGYTETGVTDNDLIQGFLKWCTEERGTNVETCRDYASYLRKPFNPSSRYSRLAYRLFLKYIGREDLAMQIKASYKPSVDLYVPSDEEVLKALRQACSSSEALCWVYKLLVYSGLRLSEVCKLLREAEDDKWIHVNEYWKYPLSWKRGAKQVFYAHTVEKPPRISVSDNWVSNWAAKSGVLNPKYIRKWVSTKMLELGISEEVINFIQGRVPQSILAKHYLKLSLLADQSYGKYAVFLKEFLKKI